MQTSKEFLADARRVLEERLGVTVSDYRLAKELGVTRSAMSRYLLGKNTFDERVQLKIAELLELNDGYVAACIQAERASMPEARAMWESVANMLRGAAALFVLGACGALLLELTTEPALLEVIAAAPCVLCQISLAALFLVAAGLCSFLLAVIVSRHAR